MVVGGGWWVVESDFSVQLEPQAEQFSIVQYSLQKSVTIEKLLSVKSEVKTKF